MDSILEIQSVSKYYKDFKAVDNVSLTVNKGEFLTILGPSGSGKTTLLNLISGFVKLNSGSILLNKNDIASKKPHERNIGMVFQNYALFPHMTVAKNIAYPLRRRKMKKNDINKKVKEILKVIKLEEHGNKYPTQLSGGQQQRVALARAIVFNPPLLLLDEPLGALDKQLRQQMQLEVKHIQESLGITTISVTHDQEEALTMSDRICVMNNGKIEQIDTPENIYKHPKNRFVAEFIGTINLLSGNLIKADSNTAKIKLQHDKIISVTLRNMKKEELENCNLLVAIRPEDIEIIFENNVDLNTIKVKVTEVIYVGEFLMVKALTKSGEEISVKVHAKFSSNVSAGKELTLGWDPSEATLLVDNIGENRGEAGVISG